MFSRTLAAYDITALMDEGGLSLSEACERVVMEKLPALAQESGSDWNNEKLQKYLSANNLDKLRNSSGACFNPAAI